MHTNDMQVLEQWYIKNTLLRLKYIQERFEKVELSNNEDLKHFYKGKKSKLSIGGLTGRVGGRLID